MTISPRKLIFHTALRFARHITKRSYYTLNVYCYESIPTSPVVCVEGEVPFSSFPFPLPVCPIILSSVAINASYFKGSRYHLFPNCDA